MIQSQQQNMNRIAIVGAGITGLSVAYQHPPTANITFFDKGRKVGGRVATRTTREYPGYAFDHGAPYVKVTGDFLALLEKLNAIKHAKVGYAQKLNEGGKYEAVHKKWIEGNPTMQEIPLRLMKNLQATRKSQAVLDAKVTKLHKDKNEFYLQAENNSKYGPFHQVYFCIPYPQCKTISQNVLNLEQFKQQQGDKVYDCSWVLMAAFPATEPIVQQFKGVDVIGDIGGSIGSMVSQRQKGNTSGDDLWVFAMKKQWSQTNQNLKPEEVQTQFRQQLQTILKREGIQFKYLKAHRWLYSYPKPDKLTPKVAQNVVFGADWAGKCMNIQQCWELGPQLYKLMNSGSGNKASL